MRHGAVIENAKARVLGALRDRPLSNADVREITQMSRHQVRHLMEALRQDGTVALRGEGRGARSHAWPP